MATEIGIDAALTKQLNMASYILGVESLMPRRLRAALIGYEKVRTRSHCVQARPVAAPMHLPAQKCVVMLQNIYLGIVAGVGLQTSRQTFKKLVCPPVVDGKTL